MHFVNLTFPFSLSPEVPILSPEVPILSPEVPILF
jgi:hypothetical protein